MLIILLDKCRYRNGYHREKMADVIRIVDCKIIGIGKWNLRRY